MRWTISRLFFAVAVMFSCAVVRLDAEEPVKKLILPGESFLIEGRPAFILWPPEEKRQKPQPWIMYAPTLPAYPDSHEKWMHEQFLAAGVAVAGIDAGEAYGSPRGQKLMSALYEELTEKRGFAAKPCLLGRSRGGLWVSSWAIANPDKAAGIAGIYPVFDLTTYPGLAKAAPAYGMTAEELESSLADHNPIARIDVLAKAKLPVCIIHGDADKVVPLAENSATLAERYKQAGAADSVTLIVAKGQGHNFWEGFFHCQELVDFAVRRAKAGAASAKVGIARPATVRVAAVQAKRRLVDWRIKQPAEVLKAVDENLAALEEIVHKTGQNCDVSAFPEDTLGLLVSASHASFRFNERRSHASSSLPFCARAERCRKRFQTSAGPTTGPSGRKAIQPSWSSTWRRSVTCTTTRRKTRPIKSTSSVWLV